MPLPYQPASSSRFMPQHPGTQNDHYMGAHATQTPHVATQGELVWMMQPENGMNQSEQQLPHSHHHHNHQHMYAAMSTVTDQSQYVYGPTMAPKPPNEGREARDFVVLEIERRLWLAREDDLNRCTVEGDESSVCPVCLEEMFLGQSVVTACNHCFHIDCCRTSESVGIRDRGYWCCPSCREVITLIKSTTVQNSAITLQLDTDPANGGSLLAMLQHNLGMASVVKSMLSLEDYLVGNYLGSEQTELNAANVCMRLFLKVPSETQAYVPDGRRDTMTHLKTEENGWVPALLSGVVDLKTLIEFGAAQPQLGADAAGGQQVDERVRDIERRKKRMYLLGFLLFITAKIVFVVVLWMTAG
ncbi:hypothetical protein GUITHDRAFT_101566 [Guillardia theta CCMP2712]|uniref:RING-type domain-containing protein n=1 Tax=Guillardia theta (strain CCMP2712) TaxID=905079 RepID=L1JXR2_GUITC|nr:hypothetical protein GUITHDRAFT_101566 [Guillardia theta CCMP2712]EKX53129.1 hypothetical protein GUITHDRAFT_101566 [Guillardia theta CCMP2712]|eukprot:XP_005840109.1 hypothetical protein GUITHDRAFT_101566 [Guillardia theta CCMP2712]